MLYLQNQSPNHSNSKFMNEVSIKGESTFQIPVSYELIEVGEKRSIKPLIIYLHGYNQNIQVLKRKMEYMLGFEAYHLFVNAPYIVFDHTRKRKVPDWGRSWYLYDGGQEQFVRSMEQSSELLETIISQVVEQVQVERICLIGYSMGGYLGGYFSLSRFHLISDAVVIGARIKTEVFEAKLKEARHIRFLALHGRLDKSVLPEPQRNEVAKLNSMGFEAEFVEVDSGHELTDSLKEPLVFWLLKQGYKLNK